MKPTKDKTSKYVFSEGNGKNQKYQLHEENVSQQ